MGLLHVLIELLTGAPTGRRRTPLGPPPPSRPPVSPAPGRTPASAAARLAPPQTVANPASPPETIAGHARVEAPATPSGRASRSTEGGLVVGSFANPRNLVAAFIVAEVLAKPVALREPWGPGVHPPFS